jgi:membrane fusion protein, adhesin transport system
MLNISKTRVADHFDKSQFEIFRRLETTTFAKRLIQISIGLFIVLVIFMFVPWTQNIQANGLVTTLRPDQRPQTVRSVIGGRIEKWFVREGDFVKKGDTILFISEVKDEYFDPNLLDRTESQLKAKEGSVSSYMDKVRALDNQVDATVKTGKLKLEQAENKLIQGRLKVTSDSIKFQAAKTNYEIAQRQYERLVKLYEEGLKSLTDLESRKLTLQKTNAELINTENDLLSSKNELINAKVELSSIRNQFADKISKTESDKYTAMSDMYNAEGDVTKLQNQFMNYSVRTGMYYITAPQDGYVTKTLQTGLGETVKPGEDLISIMPSNYSLAVELYIKPIDLPLVQKGQKVRVQFDGWPAIVFSGWPNTSYGTYGATVFAIDNFTSSNGKYRILVEPDKNDHNWPKALRVGAGTKNMLLLKDVAIGYELWRQINGFPPEFYNSLSEITSGKETKKDK